MVEARIHNRYPSISELQRITRNAERTIESAEKIGRRRVSEIYPFPEQFKSELFAKADERDAIIQDRVNRVDSQQESFIEQGSRTLRYDPNYDIAYYADGLKMSDDKEHEDKLAILDDYIDRQLQTYIGELVVTRISTIDYFLKKDANGEHKMYGKGCATSIQEMVQKGQKKRLEPDYANPIDWQREEAEIPEVDEVLTKLKHAPLGTMELVFSIPGGKDEKIANTFKEFFEKYPEKDPNKYKESSYGHEFYDLFILKERIINGERIKYIEFQRHTYGLTTREIIEKVFELSTHPFKKYIYLPKEKRINADIAAVLLSDPILIADRNEKEIQAFLHKEHSYTSEEDYQHILVATKSLRERYIQLLHQAPTEAAKIDLFSTFNHLINTTMRLKHAFNAAENYNSKISLVSKVYERNKHMSRMDMRIEGKAVTEKTGGSGCPGEDGVEVSTGSGLSDGSSILSANNSSFSVSESGLESDLTFKCPKGHVNTKSSESEWIYECQVCGIDVSCGREKPENKKETNTSPWSVADFAPNAKSESKSKPKIELKEIRVKKDENAHSERRPQYSETKLKPTA